MSADDSPAARVTPRRARCRDCGRELTARTPEPYWTVPAELGERRRAYFHVRAHNRPDGGPCPSEVAWAVGVVR